MVINTHHSILSSKSQKTLYNSLFFYNLTNFSNSKNRKVKSNIFSFKQFLQNYLFLGESTNNSLVWGQLICVYNSFFYLDIGSKTTLVKPKLKKCFENSLYKEMLLFLSNSFFKSLQVKNLINLIKQLFQYKFIKVKTFLAYVNGILLPWRFYLRKLSSHSKYLEKFFIIELKRSFSSISQKKINFFQFNILFKKYKHEN